MNNEKNIEQLEELPEWQYTENMHKGFKFASFRDAIKFVEELAPICEEINHHPDIYICYDKIRFDLSSHSKKNTVTDKDFLIAGKIEELYRKYCEIRETTQEQRPTFNQDPNYNRQ